MSKGYYRRQSFSNQLNTNFVLMHPIPLMIPDISQQDIDAVVSVLRSGNLVQGEKVQALERNIADYVGADHAVAVSNGTASLHLALVALGVGPGDEVIIPALSYIATANVVELVGAKPVFVDICLDSFNIDTQLIEESITPRTKVIMPVHEFGLACDMDVIISIAKRYNLRVIEDAACALGAKVDKKCVGTYGDVGSFSFHPRKAITSGEGGILVTNNGELASTLRSLRNHGIELVNQRMEFVMAGFNYRLTDFQAALVSSQLDRIDSILEKKNALSTIYFAELDGFNPVRLPKDYANKKHTWQSFHILVGDNYNRDKVISLMKQKGVVTNYGAQCIPYQHYYMQKYGLDCELLFPNALKSYMQGLVLPLYNQLNVSDILTVSALLKQTLNHSYA